MATYTLEEARRMVRSYGYSLKKVDGEYIARQYGAKNDDCTIYGDDLESVVNSAFLDSGVRCPRCGMKIVPSQGGGYYCGACETYVEPVNPVSYPTGITVRDFKKQLENYEDDALMRISNDFGISSKLRIRHSDCYVTLEGI